jgi:hypothetical protein
MVVAMCYTLLLRLFETRTIICWFVRRLNWRALNIHKVEWKYDLRAGLRSGLVILLGMLFLWLPDYHNNLPTPPFRLPKVPWPLVQGSLGAFLMTGPEAECFRAHTNADVRTRTEPRP